MDKYQLLPIRVLNDLVWLEPEDLETMTFSGKLILPPHGEQFGDDGKRPPIFARVVALGPGRRLPNGNRAASRLLLGDRVLVGAYEGTQLEWQNRKFLVAYEIAVHAVDIKHRITELKISNVAMEAFALEAQYQRLLQLNGDIYVAGSFGIIDEDEDETMDEIFSRPTFVGNPRSLEADELTECPVCHNDICGCWKKDA